MKTGIKLFIVFSLSLFACKTENAPNYIGEWSSAKKPWAYEAKLKINQDKTFSFSGGACTTKFQSFGKWKIVNDTLILESDEMGSEICQDNFNNNCEEVRFAKPSDSIVVKKECVKKFGDYFVIFKREKFYLKKDSLKHFYKENACNFKNDFFNKI